MLRNRLRVAVLALLVLAFVSTVKADTVVFTNEANFLSYLASPYFLQSYASYTWGNPFSANVTTASFGPVNGYSFDAYAALGLWSNIGALSTNDAFDPLVFTFTGNPVTAVGGLFSATDIGGNPINQVVTLLLNDGTTYSLTGTGFVGFTTTVPIISLTADAVDSPNYNWPAVSYLYVATPVPEPASLILLGTGLAGLWLQRRKRPV